MCSDNTYIHTVRIKNLVQKMLRKSYSQKNNEIKSPQNLKIYYDYFKMFTVNLLYIPTMYLLLLIDFLNSLQHDYQIHCSAGWTLNLNQLEDRIMDSNL